MSSTSMGSARSVSTSDGLNVGQGLSGLEAQAQIRLVIRAAGSLLTRRSAEAAR
jgi:hypothetical protein